MKAPLIIIVGYFGSGKSEFAVNLALKLAKEQSVCLADLDIINTYFRSRETREILMQQQIEVLSDTYNSTKGLDMPYLSPAIKGRIVKRDKLVILDCGGDTNGIKVLKQYYDDIVDKPYEMWMVINVFRPETRNAEQILKMMQALKNESGLEVTGFINNSNYLKSTTIEDMKTSNQIMEEVVALTKIKVVYTSGVESLMQQLPIDILGEKFPLKILLREKWL
ncbi:MAG TPA: ATP-binding protein [Bacilli bacterium]|nr:ATP-binding protein [Bacilli bacterium]